MMMDLNLFPIFDAVMTERHVGRAAEKVGRTQPAVSNAIRRMRLQFNDPLFVRAPGGVRPTAKAEDIWREVGPALDVLHSTGGIWNFDPSRIDGTLTIACTDFEATLFLKDILSIIQTAAPLVDIILRPGGNGPSQTDLITGAADIALGFLPMVPSTIRSRLLLEDSMCACMRSGHPQADKPLTIENYAKANHLLVSPAGEPRGFMDEALQARGLARRVTLVVNHFHLIVDALQSSDMLATVSANLISRLDNRAGLVIKNLPVQSPQIPISMYWHRRTDADPRLSWLRKQLLLLQNASIDLIGS
jgi:DNA-binding transcriptional LysR family regulator